MFRPVINDPIAQTAGGQPHTGRVEISFGGVRGDLLSGVGMEGCVCLGDTNNLHPSWWRCHDRDGVSCTSSSEEGHCKLTGENGFMSEIGQIHDLAKAINFLHKNSCSNAFTKRQLECKQLVVKVEWLFSSFHFELDGEMFTSPIDMIDVESKQEKKSFTGSTGYLEMCGKVNPKASVLLKWPLLFMYS